MGAAVEMCLIEVAMCSHGRLEWHAYGRMNRLSERDIREIVIVEWAGSSRNR
jgi:hypothetical protein